MSFLPPTRRPHRRGAPRRGTILIVVLALLGLFAVVGLGFVLYASNEADISRAHREKEARGGGEIPSPDPSTAVNQFLSALVYDAGDSGDALYNTVRGHGLLRAMYGWSGTASVQSGVASHTTAYNGVGTFHEQLDLSGFFTGTAPGTVLIDRAKIVNYGLVPFGSTTALQTDPEYDGFRYAGAPPVGAPANAQPLATLPAIGGTRTYVARNAPYTYPDLKDFYLASFAHATGEVTVPSFYRNWLFDPATNPIPNAPASPVNLANGALDPKNPYWLNPLGRLYTVRPRPVDQLTPTELSLLGFPLGVIPPNFGPSDGRYNSLVTTIKTKIANGELFPYPAANLDTTYTGDVKNLFGGYAPPAIPGMNTVQKNDSIWQDIGMAPIPWNGKLLKPLVAALILDLDGRLNLNAHGNIVGTGNVHASHQGLGPWEVSLEKVLGATDAAAVVQGRYGSTASYKPYANRFPITTETTAYAFQRPLDWLKQYAPYTRLPSYSQVNWSGLTATTGLDATMALPTFPNSAFQTVPAFTLGAAFNDNVYDNMTTNPSDSTDPAQSHPGLFNPLEWPAFPTAAGDPRTFPNSDMKILATRFADRLDKYRTTELFRIANAPNATLIGTETNAARYRLDPAHRNRHLFTTVSTTLDRPGLTPNFPNIGLTAPAYALGFDPTTIGPLPNNPGFLQPFPPPTTPLGVGTATDFAAGQWKNARAGLGPIDLNRPLADYRNLKATPNVDASDNPTIQPPRLNTAGQYNMGNANQAWADRHNLCRDIFARLILATGAMATVFTADDTANSPPKFRTGDVYVDPALPTTSREFAALRYLAQVAVNIVDAIDGDDISTPFVWNRLDPTNPGANLPLQAFDPTTTDLATTLNAGTPHNFDPNQLPNRVVFGTEKPRLVINEVYSEVANDPNDKAPTPLTPANRPAHVRFWVEFLNPTSNPYPTPTTPTQNMGWFSTLNPNTGMVDPTYAGSVTLRDTAHNFSPYKLVITRSAKVANGPRVTTYLNDKANVTGNVPTGFVKDIEFDFGTLTATNAVVQPNNGSSAAAPTPGFVVFGPPQTVQGATSEFHAPTVGGVWTNIRTSAGGPTQPDNTGQPSPDLSYLTDLPTNADLGNAAGDLKGLRHHVVLLRRLANPYLPPNDPAVTTGPFPYDPAKPVNLYITVDYMDFVKSHDALIAAKNGTTPRNPRPAPNGYDPFTERHAAGRVQPYAGHVGVGNLDANRDVPFGTAPQLLPAFPETFVLPQNNSTVFTTAPKHTMFRHNWMSDTAAPTATTIVPGAPGNPPTLNNTVMAPFDWMPHFDRPLLNVLELLEVRGGKPFELTQHFLREPAPPSPAVVRRDVGLIPWIKLDPTDATFSRTGHGLYRALDLLRVKSLAYGGALGGRVPGRININTVQDPRVLRALLDAPTTAAAGGNLFADAEVFGGAGNDLWTRLIGSRTPNIDTVNRKYVDGTAIPVPIPGRTFDDDPTNGTDRPFKPFATGEFGLGSGAPYAGGGAVTTSIGPGLQDTLLRLHPDPDNPNARVPVLWLDQTTAPANLDRSHPYFRAEAARKLVNNVTTVSNTFAVWLTVGFFEVRTDPTTGQVLTRTMPDGTVRHLLGREAYKEAPSDLRVRYYVVVDRTASTVHPTVPTQPALDPNDASRLARPFFTALKTAPVKVTIASVDYYKLYVDPEATNLSNNPRNMSFRSDGEVVNVYPGNQIYVGTGADQELVTVSGIDEEQVFGQTTGTMIRFILVPATSLTRAHGAGAVVTNARLGNPGPQTTFNPTGHPVVPYFSRVP